MQDSLYYSWVTVPAVPWLFPSQCNAVNRQRPLWSMKFTNWEDDEGSIAGALEWPLRGFQRRGHAKMGCLYEVGQRSVTPTF